MNKTGADSMRHVTRHKSCFTARTAMNTTDKLAPISAIRMAPPQLSAADHAEYASINARLQRTGSDLRRATKLGDAKKLAAAERALARATAARNAFVTPRVGHLPAPARIIGKFESRWSGPNNAGRHFQECAMVLDHKDLSGPQYRTVRVLLDIGGPPTNARSAPDTMGVAWSAIAEQIKCGKIVVLGDEEPS
jgi:hypothetical protein